MLNASLERYSPKVGEVRFPLHPEFIAGLYKRMVRAGPRSRGLRSPTKETPMREAPKRARHVNYAPVAGPEGNGRGSTQFTCRMLDARDPNLTRVADFPAPRFYRPGILLHGCIVFAEVNAFVVTNISYF